MDKILHSRHAGLGLGFVFGMECTIIPIVSGIRVLMYEKYGIFLVIFG